MEINESGITAKKKYFTNAMLFARGFVPFKNKLLLIPPTAPGSMGDQALVSGLLSGVGQEHLRRSRVAAYKTTDSWPDIDSCKMIDLNQYFITGDGFAFASMALRNMQCKHAVMIGADVLDGKYSKSRSIRRIELASLLSAMGVDVTICSFSYNASPGVEVDNAFKSICPRVRLVVRDAISQKRVQKLLGREVVLGADLAFLLQPECSQPGVRKIESQILSCRESGTKIIGLNLNYLHFSGLSSDEVDVVINNYCDVIRVLRESCARLLVVGLPHDIRSPTDDFYYLQRLKDLMAGNNIPVEMLILPREFTAASTKYVAGLTDYVVTGRMHIAIAALGQGVPVAGIAYQGKFEGLMGHFGIEDNLLSHNDHHLYEPLAHLFHLIDTKSTEYRSMIQGSLKRVQSLAQKNVPPVLRAF